ncbi:hypothetical protein BaRGS_00002790 [Batillaria attramentaria]|uniref:Apple domain-containing protein n=1 Tax=Batillaria attramentaria TaxID=370345 RepID=A0ABD0M3X1_9CAEN
MAVSRCLCSLLLLWNLLAEGSCGNENCFIVYPNSGLYPLPTTHFGSLYWSNNKLKPVDCLKYCASLPDKWTTRQCFAFNYIASTATCLVYGESQRPVEHAGDAYGERSTNCGVSGGCVNVFPNSGLYPRPATYLASYYLSGHSLTSTGCLEFCLSLPTKLITGKCFAFTYVASTAVCLVYGEPQRPVEHAGDVYGELSTECGELGGNLGSLACSFWVVVGSSAG